MIRKWYRDELLAGKMLTNQFKKQKKFLLENINYLRERQNMCLSALYLLQWQPNRVEVPYNQLVKSLDYEKSLLDFDWEEWLSGFWTEMGLYATIDKLVLRAEKALTKWYKNNLNQNKNVLKPLGIVFTPRLIDKYVDMLEDVQLSDYVGSINRTTKLAVLEEIKIWVQQNLTYTQVAKNITKVSETLFSPARAKLIATTEMGRAYWYGNYIPMRQAADLWETVVKSWSTVGDNKVRETHYQNERDGEIGIDQAFSWTGDMIAPSSDLNCRCDTLRDIK